jgi:hypothetical protein
MDYSIGQVLFVVDKKSTKVFPIQVIEEITKKTIQGEIVSYVISVGSGEGERLPLDDLKHHEVFDSAESVKIALSKRAAETISRIVDSAAQKAVEWYGPGVVESHDTNEKIHDIASPHDGMMVTLADGRIAKVNVRT